MSLINSITQQISSFLPRLSHDLNTTQRRIMAVAVVAITALATCYLFYRWCTSWQSKKVVQLLEPPQPAIASWDELKNLLATKEPDAKGRLFVPGYGAVFKGVIEDVLYTYKHDLSVWDTLKECTVMCSNKEVKLDGLTTLYLFGGIKTLEKQVNLRCFSSRELKKIIQVLSDTKKDGNFCFHIWKSISDHPDQFKEFTKYIRKKFFLNKLIKYMGNWGHEWFLRRAFPDREFIPLKAILQKDQILFIQDLLEVLCAGWPCSYKVLDIEHMGLKMADFFEEIAQLSEQEQLDFYQMIKDQPKTIQAFIIYCEREDQEKVFKRILESLEDEEDHRLIFFENILQYSQESICMYGKIVRTFICQLCDDQVENLIKLLIEQSSHPLELILKWISVLKNPQNTHISSINKILAIATPYFSPQDIQKMQNCESFFMSDLHQEFPFFKEGRSILPIGLQ